jgi:hypothetical protein
MGAANRAKRSLKVIQGIGQKDLDAYFACFKRAFAQGTVGLS